jgi:hypothetical protein
MNYLPDLPCCKECLVHTNIAYSIEHNHLNCVKYFQGCTCNKQTTILKNDNIYCLIYDHQNCCRWYPSTTYIAAKNSYHYCRINFNPRWLTWQLYGVKADGIHYIECLKYIYLNYKFNMPPVLNEVFLPYINEWKKLVDLALIDKKVLPKDIITYMYNFW